MEENSNIQLNNFVFIIPVKQSNNISDKDSCVRCIKSIRKFYQDTKIIIINDSAHSIASDSDLKNFFNDENIIVTHCEVEGSGNAYALNYFYNNNIGEYAIILHDSTELIKKFSPFNFDIKFFWYFVAHHIWNRVSVPQPNNLIKTHEDEILNFYKNLKYSKFKDDFIRSYYNKLSWKGCFGTMFVISKNFLNLLEEKTSILSLTQHVKSRRDRMCMESIMGVAVFYTKKFDIKDEYSYSLQGQWEKAVENAFRVGIRCNQTNSIIGEYIGKFSLGR